MTTQSATGSTAVASECLNVRQLLPSALGLLNVGYTGGFARLAEVAGADQLKTFNVVDVSSGSC